MNITVYMYKWFYGIGVYGYIDICQPENTWNQDIYKTHDIGTISVTEWVAGWLYTAHSKNTAMLGDVKVLFVFSVTQPWP